MSLQKIKVSKTELLGIVIDNKKKHDEIYEAAKKGYWVDAKEFLLKHQKDQLEQLKKNYLRETKDLKKQVAKELKMVEQKKKDGYVYMRKPFPENHSDDYQGTISRLKLSVDPEIELENAEFDCYVRNKWQWRNSFLSTNSTYALSSSYSMGDNFAWTSGSYYGSSSWASYSISSSWASSSLSSAYYTTAVNNAISNF